MTEKKKKTQHKRNVAYKNSGVFIYIRFLLYLEKAKPNKPAKSINTEVCTCLNQHFLF